jgi:hypothetical protein
MFSVQALDAAKNYGARTVLITGVRSPPIANTDFRLETCFQGNSEASTISVLSKRMNTNPDTAREDQYNYRHAKNL